LAANDLTCLPDGVEIDGKQALPVLVAKRQGIGVKSDAGIVDKHVDWAKLARHRSNHVFEIGAVRDICGYRDSRYPELAKFRQRLFALLLVARRDGDRSSSLSQADGNSPADAAIATRDDGDFAVHRELVHNRHDVAFPF
jgi:hypothetical protein